MNALWVVLLLAGNAFFVAAEFALVASKRHRLEQMSGRGASAALAGTRQLSVMLAGAQLGITLCSLGLGALAEPALEHLLAPLLHGFLPSVASHVIAFLLALVVVTFLHLVIGEMMPKSWAITHPERSASLLAVPFVAFTRLARPALRVLNALANVALRPFGVHPQDQLAVAHGPAEMRILLDRSAVEGSIAAEQTQLLTSMLELNSLRVRDLAAPVHALVTVPPTADATAIERASLTSGRSRLAVSANDGRIVGVVHVRDAVRAATADHPVTAAELMDPPFVLDAESSVVEAVTAMRAGRAQLALVGPGAGFVALEDLLEQVIGRFDDETDQVPA
ncbi:HlyC/CorC family transporter [Actinoplanes sp. TBRC 11911]|uniref:hemolysin family protein n=1 Tax=Actinoplanes sp. TBRC 11911 TaxID=2729386 RepID=UPI00145D4BEB|nr:hemolysin family protein [Actinoplanes sp. TBRC 11911]NMO57420.1 HlyC/CorC family transporter [Actinoplanes sp. TBRC 11911]